MGCMIERDGLGVIPGFGFLTWATDSVISCDGVGQWQGDLVEEGAGSGDSLVIDDFFLC